MLSALAPRVRLWAGIATLVVAGCGGGEAAAPDTTGGGDGQATNGQDGSAGDGGGATVGPVTLTADPGSAWAEVDGGRLEYSASGGLFHECTVAGDRVTVNFQTNEGHDLLLQGSNQGSGWILNLTFKPGEGDDVGYGATSRRGEGTFGVGDGAVSYEGPVDRIVGVDLANKTVVDARVAINCASGGGGSAGGDPGATIGGQAYTFALSGAQSVTCEVGPERVEVRINRLAIDDTQLEIDGRREGDRWIGAAVIYTGDGNYTATFQEDGTGLTIDGSSVEFDGAFRAPDGSEVNGTASATCP